MDFLQFTMDLVVKIDRGEEEGNFEDYVKSMPPILQPNYFFSNQRGEKFINQNQAWKLIKPSVSQGAAYGDLDNDGDLDIVVNNSNEYAWLYRNNENADGDNKYITFKLKGPVKNIDGLGSKVIVYAGDKSFTKELQTCRGFQSGMENKIFFGLGDIDAVDSVYILWPDGKEQIQRGGQVNQLHQINYAPDSIQKTKIKPPPYFMPTELIAYERTASTFNDFKSQLLLPFFMTDVGPVGLTGDVNRDGKEDLIIIGDMENPTVLFSQAAQGTFQKSDMIPAGKEISDAILMDIDGDKDNDLVAAVGSYKFHQDVPDKGIYFYSNDGKGKFTLAEFLSTPGANPSSIAFISDSSSADQLYIVGSNSYQGKFPHVGPLYIVKKNTSGKHEIHETRMDAGCVNDMIKSDLDRDGMDEIIVAAEWKPLQVFRKNKDLSLTNVTSNFFQSQESGLWQSVYMEDSDGDGVKELFAGNLGTNNQLTASADHPLRLYYDDYDRNGSPDPIIAYYQMDDTYPFPPREDMIRQVPMMNKRFGSFGLYAKANINTLLGEAYDTTRMHQVQTLENSLYKWEGGKFERYALPSDMQVAPIFCFHKADIDRDGKEEILTAGNMTKTKVKLGRLNGNHGMILGKENNELVPVDYSATGINVRGDVRQIVKLEVPGGIIIGYLCHEGRSEFYERMRK